MVEVKGSVCLLYILIFLSKKINWMSAIWKNSMVYKYKESEFCHFGIVLLGEVS